MLDRLFLRDPAGRHSTWVLLRYRLWSALHGRAFYVAGVAGLVLVAAMLGDFMNYLARTGLAISQDQLRTPLTLTLSLAAVYLSLSALVGISREREQGTLLVLSFGPVDLWGYLLSWQLAQMFGYLVLCLLLGVGAASMAGLAGLPLSGALLPLLALSILSTAGVIAFGILIGSAGRDLRNSLLAFLGVTLVLLVLEGLDAFFGSLQAGQLPGAWLPVSRTVSLVSGALAWVSPYSFLPRGLAAIYAHDWGGYLANAAGALAYAAILLVFARLGAERRGVVP